MPTSLRRRLLRLPEAALAFGPLTWERVEALARALPPKTNLVVPKAVLAVLPPWARSRLGRARGARRQFRCDRPQANLHVKEFERHWVVHVDGWNPLRHPLRHLLSDRGYSRFLHLNELLTSAGASPGPAPAPAA